jgi:hypothetical protein
MSLLSEKKLADKELRFHAFAVHLKTTTSSICIAMHTNNGSVWAIENPLLWVSPATVISYGSWQTFFVGEGGK